MDTVVYLVYEHNYDASCNHGVFSTLEKAQAYIDKWQINQYSVNMVIETWIVDDEPL